MISDAFDATSPERSSKPRIVGFWAGELKELHGYRVRKPIRYEGIERSGNGERFSVCAPELLAYGQGKTREEALRRLREDIVAFWCFLSARQGRLGVVGRWLDIYCEYLEALDAGEATEE